MGEDHSGTRTDYAADNLAAFRRLALNILRRETTKKRGMKDKQRRAGWDQAYLLKLLGFQPPLAAETTPSPTTAPRAGPMLSSC